MTTSRRHHFIALTLGVGLSASWLSTVVLGMQNSATPSLRTIELAPVVIVARKASAPQATAQTKPTAAKCG